MTDINGILDKAEVSPKNIFSALSTQSSYMNCRDIENPDHIVWARKRNEMETEAAGDAKDACRLAGFDVCEVIDMRITWVPWPEGGESVKRCYMKAVVKGGYAPKE